MMDNDQKFLDLIDAIRAEAQRQKMNCGHTVYSALELALAYIMLSKDGGECIVRVHKEPHYGIYATIRTNNVFGIYEPHRNTGLVNIKGLIKKALQECKSDAAIKKIRKRYRGV